MLNAGPAKKVSIYVGEDHQYHGQSLYAAILDFLFYRGISGASVVRGIAGFGADHHLHTTRIERLTENLPIKIEFVESAEKVEELLPKLHELAGTGLIDVQDTLVVKPSEESAKGATKGAAVALKREGKAKLMRIFIGENDKWHDKPLHKALVESMRANDIAGVDRLSGHSRLRREPPHSQRQCAASFARPPDHAVGRRRRREAAGLLPDPRRDGAAGARGDLRCGRDQVHARTSSRGKAEKEAQK